jgi:hypothetical protein
MQNFSLCSALTVFKQGGGLDRAIYTETWDVGFCGHPPPPIFASYDKKGVVGIYSNLDPQETIIIKSPLSASL